MRAEQRILSILPPNLNGTFNRWNKWKIAALFPNKKKDRCACGCGRKLKGRKRRWATKKCNEFAYIYLRILQGDRDTIFWLISIRDSQACCNCGSMHNLELDHILPICKGGGGLWLDNYQILCTECHKEKTKSDSKL